MGSEINSIIIELANVGFCANYLNNFIHMYLTSKELYIAGCRLMNTCTSYLALQILTMKAQSLIIVYCWLLNICKDKIKMFPVLKKI